MVTQTMLCDRFAAYNLDEKDFVDSPVQGKAGDEVPMFLIGVYLGGVEGSNFYPTGRIYLPGDEVHELMQMHRRVRAWRMPSTRNRLE